MPTYASSGSLWEKALRSLAFRSGPLLYRPLLARFPAPRFRERPGLGIPMLTMCGGQHLAMLEQALYSIALNWSEIPELTIVSDGTVEVDVVLRRLKWWPAELSARSWESDRDYHRAVGRPELGDYAERHPFGRKLSTVLATAEQRRFLWIDCDILFYADFTPLIPESKGRTEVMTALDWCYGYDPQLIKVLPHLLTRPPVNTGVAIYQGNLYDTCELGALVERTAEYCDNFTEQTILAEAVFQTGEIAWDLNAIRIFDDDIYSLRPSFLGQGWLARHYVTNVRHLLWRDALALRVGARW